MDHHFEVFDSSVLNKNSVRPLQVLRIFPEKWLLKEKEDESSLKKLEIIYKPFHDVPFASFEELLSPAISAFF